MEPQGGGINSFQHLSHGFGGPVVISKVKPWIINIVTFFDKNVFQLCLRLCLAPYLWDHGHVAYGMCGTIKYVILEYGDDISIFLVCSIYGTNSVHILINATDNITQTTTKRKYWINQISHPFKLII